MPCVSSHGNLKSETIPCRLVKAVRPAQADTDNERKNLRILLQMWKRGYALRTSNYTEHDHAVMPRQLALGRLRAYLPTLAVASRLKAQKHKQ